MSRILVTCPSSRLPVATGRHTPGIDLATLIGEHAFRCRCGSVHVWEADGAWVEDERSLARETAAGMAQLQAYLGRPSAPIPQFAEGMTLDGGGTRRWRECLLNGG